VVNECNTKITRIFFQALRVSRLDLRVLRVAFCAAALIGCRTDQPAHEAVPVTVQLGSWQGRGNATLGFVSDSGRFRVTWTARDEMAPEAPRLRSGQAGRLHLTIHSAVSGRPLQEVVDQHGEGSGTYDFSDDPRSYNIMVESNDIEWSIIVDGTSTIRPAPK
jgi:hypothetical protein